MERIDMTNTLLKDIYSWINVFKTRKGKLCQRNMSRFIEVFNP